MIYIIDNILNYIIYLFISYFGFQLSPRKNRVFQGASILTVLIAGAFNACSDTNSPFVYIVWSVLSISLFFEGRLFRLTLLSAAFMYFTGIMDTFSVMLIQVILIGGGIADNTITWWMEPAYLLSFLVYLLVYFRLLRKNEVYLCEIGMKYKLLILIQGSIFQMFYNFVFVFFNENSAMYGWDAYITFFVSIAGAIYSLFLTLSLAIKNILSDRQNRELEALMLMQRQQYDYQLQQSVKLRCFKHDLANHIGALRELINQKRAEDAKAYIDRIWQMQEDFDLKLRTGDSFLDVIVNYYLYLAEKEHIEFTVSGRLTEKIPLEMVDITSLMGNVLQNAVEAAGKAAVPEIRVELVTGRRENFIAVSNSVSEEADIKRNLFISSKKDGENHGFGMKNIAAAVRKYHGEYFMDSTVENGRRIFKISISIPRGNEV